MICQQYRGPEMGTLVRLRVVLSNHFDWGQDRGKAARFHPVPSERRTSHVATAQSALHSAGENIRCYRKNYVHIDYQCRLRGMMALIPSRAL
jgi:hypothetical protein